MTDHPPKRPGGVLVLPDRLPEFVQWSRALVEDPADNTQHRLLVVPISGVFVGQLENQIGDRLVTQPTPGAALDL